MLRVRWRRFLRAVWLRHFSEWVVCLEPDPTYSERGARRVRPISAEKCGSASAGKCAPEEALHQSSLWPQACSSPLPYQAEGGRRRGENESGQPIPGVTTDWHWPHQSL